jgi:signal transduction histidine kinase
MPRDPSVPSLAEYQDDLDAIARMESVKTILEVICRTTGLGFSAVARVSEDRWIACAVRDEIAFGLKPGGELPIATTLCNEVRAHRDAIVIDHVALDERYCQHHTPRKYGFQSYISVPIFRRSGGFFGTLCAIDPKPARLKATSTLATFELFAQLIALHLDFQEQLAASERALVEARKAAELRERFVAVLGHDVRNPLGAIMSAAGVLEQNPDESSAVRMTSVIKRSGARIGELVDSLLDFARGRFGGGLSTMPSAGAELSFNLAQIIQEFRASSPAHPIEAQIALEKPVRCDTRRIEQMLSNLIANAITHGDPSGTITVTAASNTDEFVLSVANRGPQIPAFRLATIFEAFRGSNESTGLGLGLYICSEIARAHHGSLNVTSTEEETRFVFRMPTNSGVAP